MSRQKRNRRAEQAAADLVRLYRVATETPNIDSWRDQSTDYQQAFLESVEVMAELEVLADDPEIAAAAGQQVAKVTTLEKAQERWPRWAVAATVVLSAAVALNQWFVNTQNAENGVEVQRYVTRVGEQKTVELADGSIVNLNTGSQLLVEWSDQQRKVTLRRGEAFFEVAKAADRPFTVELGTQSITVLGTSFNVRTEPDAFELVVADGLVAIHPTTDQLTGSEVQFNLAAGESELVPAQSGYKVPANTRVQYRADSRKLTAHHELAVASYYQWRAGQLRFEYEPLMEVVKELNRYSVKKILIEDDSIMNMKIYALVKLDQLDSALLGLERIMPIKVIKYFDRIVIIGDGNRQ